MPHIRIRGLEKSELVSICSALVTEVSEVTTTPASHFTVERIATEFIAGGISVSGEPFCEILWFDRGQELQDRVAAIVTKHLKKLEANKDVVVVFTVLDRARYYENGQHF